MRNPTHNTMTKISTCALLAGMSTIGLGAISGTAHAVTEAQINHINTVSRIANSKISLITIHSATSQATSTPVHHSFFGSIISGIGHAIKGVTHTVGSIINTIGNTITGVTHAIGSVIKTIPKVIVSGIFAVKHALVSPLNFGVSIAKTGLGILSEGVSLSANIATATLGIIAGALSLASLIPDIGIPPAIAVAVLDFVNLGISVGANLIITGSNLASQFLPPLIYGTENLVLGPGHAIDSAIGNTIGGAIGGTISGVGLLVGATINGIGHALTSISAPSTSPDVISNVSNITTPAVKTHLPTVVTPPQVSLLG